MKRPIILFFIFLLSLTGGYLASGSDSSNLNGKILLQIELKGEAWYINPQDSKRYYLGRPVDAFALMRSTGLGINNKDLNKISIGSLAQYGLDTDKDGVNDSLEKALGTSSDDRDTDKDGYDDYTEITNNQNPLGLGKLPINTDLSNKLSGRILLQTENYGQAWYVNPVDKKRYYLNRPTDTLEIMQRLGLGITNKALNNIPIGSQNVPQVTTTTPQAPSTSGNATISPEKVLQEAAKLIADNKTTQALKYFTKDVISPLEFGLKYVSDQGKKNLGYLMIGATLSNSNNTEKVYANDVYFPLDGKNKKIYFTLTKQPDGRWLISKL